MLTKLHSVVAQKTQILLLSGGKLRFSIIIKAIISVLLRFSISITVDKAKKG